MARHGTDAHLISTLDDVAWLLNLRGADVPFNPVFLAHVLLTPTTAALFVQAGKVAPALRERLQADRVTLAPYEGAAAALAALDEGTTLLVDPLRSTAGMRARVPNGVRVVEADNPSTLKSRKSAAEIDHVRAAMEQDGAALCEFFAWLEEALAEPYRAAVAEVEIADRLVKARARRPGFVSPSFATIAGFGANGAIVHYQATEAACARIEGNGLLLIDSGRQYLGGTTGITRMVPVGRIGAAEKRDCTLVLKGLIALSSARFPRGIEGPLSTATSLRRAKRASAATAHRARPGRGPAHETLLPLRFSCSASGTRARNRMRMAAR